MAGTAGRLLTIVAVMLLGLATENLAAPITLPTGLNPGDQYRLGFVSSTTRDATSQNIADYNDFVTATANRGPGTPRSWNHVEGDWVNRRGKRAATTRTPIPTRRLGFPSIF